MRACHQQHPPMRMVTAAASMPPRAIAVPGFGGRGRILLAQVICCPRQAPACESLLCKCLGGQLRQGKEPKNRCDGYPSHGTNAGGTRLLKRMNAQRARRTEAPGLWPPVGTCAELQLPSFRWRKREKATRVDRYTEIARESPVASAKAGLLGERAWRVSICHGTGRCRRRAAPARHQGMNTHGHVTGPARYAPRRSTRTTLPAALWYRTPDQSTCWQQKV